MSLDDLSASLCNKPPCRNRACTDFYRAANVHRAARRNVILPAG